MIPKEFILGDYVDYNGRLAVVFTEADEKDEIFILLESGDAAKVDSKSLKHLSEDVKKFITLVNFWQVQSLTIDELDNQIRKVFGLKS